MRRYIDADKLLTDEILHILPFGCGRASGRAVVFVEDIEKIPTADVVEVVRCKDCFYSEKTLSDECPKECSWCRKLCFVTHENHYCSYGERREG